ncbi:type VI secretion system baseplate subunit TssG [Denitromonas iodatirespirans]|uniref:Type VI secretion system baseplate subunit TssG n=1 Tax=Denitromonas iodatirespirans TaxID=2795389 RepID=A0A944DSP1_DENI1|nr:type VI secretion system baseplate subunit TssG [Denitromonas iodatirespirans]MBT0963769.1 type VI secretion system baseplate subunit TssG [Denitromonas iodatirespirans]
MCAAHRRIDPGLIDQLAEAPQRFEFFQAVRMLEHWTRRSRPLRDGDPVSDRIRFRNSLSLNFAPSDLENLEITPPAEAGQGTRAAYVHVTPRFIGLLGLHGGLPAHYTERIARLDRTQRELGSGAFFDMLSNRLVGHFYRAWKKYRLPVQYEYDRKNRFLPLVLALSGLGFDALRDRLHQGPGSIDDESIAHFAGLLRQRPVSAAALQSVLATYFGVPIRIEQFVGKWYALPAGQRSVLGGQNAALGKTCLLGERVWQRNLRVRVHIGPLDHASYLSFLPGGEFAAVLEKLLTLATGYQFEYEVRPVLRAADVHPVRLGAGGGARLGFDSFMITRPAAADRSDTVFELHSAH